MLKGDECWYHRPPWSTVVKVFYWVVYGNACFCCRAGGVYTSGWWLLYIYLYHTPAGGLRTSPASQVTTPHDLWEWRPAAQTQSRFPPPLRLTRVLYILTTYGSRMFIPYQQRLSVDLGKIRIAPNLHLHGMRPPWSCSSACQLAKCATWQYWVKPQLKSWTPRPIL